MAAVDDLITRRDAICAELAAMASTTAGGLPNASGPDAIDHVGYKRALYEELRGINELIASISGPIEEITEGFV